MKKIRLENVEIDLKEKKMKNSKGSMNLNALRLL